MTRIHLRAIAAFDGNFDWIISLVLALSCASQIPGSTQNWARPEHIADEPLRCKSSGDFLLIFFDQLFMFYNNKILYGCFWPHLYPVQDSDDVLEQMLGKRNKKHDLMQIFW